jgi:hypothetical protein
MQKLKIVFAILIAIIVCETIFIIVLLVKGKGQNLSATADKSFTKGIENVYVQVRVNRQTTDGMFTDSIYYTADEWSKMKAEDVQKAIQARVDNWEKVTHPAENQ